MADDVRLNKAATIERCLARVREEYGSGGNGLDADLRRQDALVLNLLRACETTIGLAIIGRIVEERLVDFEAFVASALAR